MSLVKSIKTRIKQKRQNELNDAINKAIENRLEEEGYGKQRETDIAAFNAAKQEYIDSHPVSAASASWRPEYGMSQHPSVQRDIEAEKYATEMVGYNPTNQDSSKIWNKFDTKNAKYSLIGLTALPLAGEVATYGLIPGLGRIGSGFAVANLGEEIGQGAGKAVDLVAEKINPNYDKHIGEIVGGVGGGLVGYGVGSNLFYNKIFTPTYAKMFSSIVEGNDANMPLYKKIAKLPDSIIGQQAKEDAFKEWINNNPRLWNQYRSWSYYNSRPKPQSYSTVSEDRLLPATEEVAELPAAKSPDALLAAKEPKLLTESKSSIPAIESLIEEPQYVDPSLFTTGVPKQIGMGDPDKYISRQITFLNKFLKGYSLPTITRQKGMTLDDLKSKFLSIINKNPVKSRENVIDYRNFGLSPEKIAEEDAKVIGLGLNPESEIDRLKYYSIQYHNAKSGISGSWYPRLITTSKLTDLSSDVHTWPWVVKNYNGIHIPDNIAFESVTGIPLSRYAQQTMAKYIPTEKERETNRYDWSWKPVSWDYTEGRGSYPESTKEDIRTANSRLAAFGHPFRIKVNDGVGHIIVPYTEGDEIIGTTKFYETVGQGLINGKLAKAINHTNRRGLFTKGYINSIVNNLRNDPIMAHSKKNLNRNTAIRAFSLAKKDALSELPTNPLYQKYQTIVPQIESVSSSYTPFWGVFDNVDPIYPPDIKFEDLGIQNKTNVPIPKSQILPEPGFTLRSLMYNGPIFKMVEKNGLINKNNLLNKIKTDANIPKNEKELLTKIINYYFPNDKNISFVDLRTAVNKNIPHFGHVETSAYNNYGIHRLGYNNILNERGVYDPLTRQGIYNIVQGYNGKTPVYVPRTILLDTDKTFGGKDLSESIHDHFRSNGGVNNIGHFRGFVTTKEPNVFHLSETQSDAYQHIDEIPFTSIPVSSNGQIYIGDLVYPNRPSHGDLPTPSSIKSAIASGKPLFTGYLQSNWFNRFLSESMLYAHNNGLTKFRTPHVQTIADIEGYWPIKIPESERAKLVAMGLEQDYENHLALYQTYEAQVEKLNKQVENAISNRNYDDIYRLRNEIDDVVEKLRNEEASLSAIVQQANIIKSNNYRDYKQKLQGILKRYDDIGKSIYKTLRWKPSSTPIVKDANGNLWYEFDIPADYGQQELRAFKEGGQLVKNLK